jgi:hypothetical protein
MDLRRTSSPPAVPEPGRPDGAWPASTEDVRRRLEQGYALDQLWWGALGLAADTKEPALRTVAEVLEASGTPYAVIGGVAMQLHSPEPRTTLDLGLAVRRIPDVPREALLRAGFEHEGRFPFRDNWRAPGTGSRLRRTAVQFSAEDVGLDDAVARARVLDAGGFRLRLASPLDLLVLKLATAEEPWRRPSKRRQDLVDIVTLSEQYPEVTAMVADLERRVERLTAALMTVGRTRRPER